MSWSICKQVGAILQSWRWNPLEESSPDKSELPSLSLPMSASVEESAESKQQQLEEAEETDACLADDEGKGRMNSSRCRLTVDKHNTPKVIWKENEDLEKNKDTQLVCDEENSEKMNFDEQLAYSEDTEQKENVQLVCNKDDHEKYEDAKENAQLACNNDDKEKYEDAKENVHLVCNKDDEEKYEDARENVHLVCTKDDAEKEEDAQVAYNGEQTEKLVSSHLACKEDVEKRDDNLACSNDFDKNTNALLASNLEMGEDNDNTLEVSPQTNILDEKNDYTAGQETLTRPSAMKGSAVKLSPPFGTHSKKEVHFADSVGVELASVHCYGEPPINLNKMIKVLSKLEENKHSAQKNRWSPKFDLSGQGNYFKERINQHKVVVESAYADELNKITGTVCVLNIAYEKQVVVRYTNNNWLTVCEVVAEHSMTSPCGKYDFFSFDLSIDNQGVALAFVVFYAVGSDIFWDNNFGQNFCFGTNL